MSIFDHIKAVAYRSLISHLITSAFITAKAPNIVTPSQQVYRLQVMRGDFVLRLAKRHHINAELITATLRQSGRNPNLIRPGEVIVIRRPNCP